MQEEERLNSNIVLEATLGQHVKKISAICGDFAAKMVGETYVNVLLIRFSQSWCLACIQIYTGSHDGFVKCWNTDNGQVGIIMTSSS